ncbi:MAG: tRNA (adenosine(37)-N6)-threonylcarbamoyltransferase complex ATPase subunit type 1 TsaE, partial [Candidatus Dormibacteraeota bacterium]|nr:tRNA (adenosine(37)-N6)-threonylcarbamoyltransferase complex ATPase subunit type 1 TsaE [Candidatus Dormibacteraeota bacterium]
MITSTPEETEEVAATLGRRLRRGDLLLLIGELGAGKTTFVRGLARG